MSRMAIAILERFQCNGCDDQFYVKQREGEKYCPYCGSIDTDLDGTFCGTLEETE